MRSGAAAPSRIVHISRIRNDQFHFTMYDILRRWQLCAHYTYIHTYGYPSIRDHLPTNDCYELWWAFIFNIKPIISSLGRYFYGFFPCVVSTRVTVNFSCVFSSLSLSISPSRLIRLGRVHCFSFWRLLLVLVGSSACFDQHNLLSRHVDDFECICLAVGASVREYSAWMIKYGWPQTINIHFDSREWERLKGREPKILTE